MATAYRIELKPGDVLFREGDAPTTAFLIEAGVLRITAEREGAPMLLGELSPGALVGEMAVLDDSRRSATATALAPCVLTPIDRAQFAERLQAADPVVRALLLSQLSRYRTALATFTGNEPAPAPAAAGAESAHALDKIRLESQLRNAMANRELEIRLQPIQHIASGRLAGFEALTRWTHPERGVVSPADFIALAEETSLIVPVGEYVLREVCVALRRIADEAPHTRPFIAFNVSGRQVGDADYVERVLAQLREHAVPPEQLKLEITESLVLDYGQIATLIERAHAAGMRVALDDFGTGYSNLGHLHKLTFDTIKIDQGFIRQLEDPRCLAIVRAVIGMAGALGCDIVAEGVETPEHLAQLKVLGCQYAQGWLVGKPLTVDAALGALMR
ncbi:MAG: EAL domain-containing protein [Xanthomonadaceae bacterium]|nr:EAL domain-containing protein [Xanthomonadaceae bacterium]